MTPRQKELARHALGLPNEFKKSCRNRFFAHPGGGNWTDWKAMTDAGFAEHKPATEEGRQDFFHLTRAGAEHVLGAKEKLDPKHFPPIGAH